MSNKMKPQFGTFPRKGVIGRRGLKLDLAMLRGGDLNDYSLNGNNGTNIGATWVAGPNGPVLSFDGIDDNILLPEAVTRAMVSANEFTITAKVRTNQVSTDAAIVSEWSELAAGQVLLLWLDVGGDNPSYSVVIFHSDGSNTGTSQNIDNVTINKWQSVTATYTGDTLSISVDGVLSDEVPVTKLIRTPTTGIAYIGFTNHTSSRRPWSGEIDYTQISDKALTAQAIRQQFDFPWKAWEKDNLPLWVAAQGGAAPPTGAYMPQIQKANLGASLYNGTLVA